MSLALALVAFIQLNSAENYEVFRALTSETRADIAASMQNHTGRWPDEDIADVIKLSASADKVWGACVRASAITFGASSEPAETVVEAAFGNCEGLYKVVIGWYVLRTQAEGFKADNVRRANFARRLRDAVRPNMLAEVLRARTAERSNP